MKTIAIVSLLLLSVLATVAQAVQFFDFTGQAVLPAAVGQDAVAYGIILNGDAPEAPLPLNTPGAQYTLVVTGLTLTGSGASDVYSGGFVAIYEDASTAADYANPSTFRDGAMILGGVLTSLTHTMLLGTLGSANGYVDWNSGARLNDLAPADQTGWPFLVAVYRNADLVEPGYTEMWDGKVEPSGDVVANEDRSWSQVKALFR